MPVGVADILAVDEADVMPSVQPFTEEDFAEAWRETNSLLPSTSAANSGGGRSGR